MVRVAEVLRAELARLIARERSLEGLLITLTGVEVSPDMRHAYVLFSSLREDAPREEMLSRLLDLRAEFQTAIGRAMKTKFTPRLHFRFDDAQKRGDRVMQILESLRNEPPPA